MTKNAGTMLLQQIAQDVSPDKMRIINYHPGLIETETVKSLMPADYMPEFVPWDSRKYSN